VKRCEVPSHLSRDAESISPRAPAAASSQVGGTSQGFTAQLAHNTAISRGVSSGKAGNFSIIVTRVRVPVLHVTAQQGAGGHHLCRGALRPCWLLWLGPATEEVVRVL
jgi:hypothetical protein